jgi:amino acid transporter
VITSQLDTWLGKTLPITIAVAIFSATLAIQASASRVMFSMARDNRLPFGKLVSKVNKRTGTPPITGTTVNALAILVLLVNLGPGRGVRGHHQCVGGDRVLDYLMVTVAALLHRLRGTSLSYGPRSWTSASGASR